MEARYIMSTERGRLPSAVVAELVECCRDHPAIEERHRAFGRLVSAFQDMAFGYAYTLLGEAQAAQDAAQEAFITAYLQMDALRDPRAFPGWFKRILWSQCGHLRRGAPSEAPLDRVFDADCDAVDPLEAMEQRETRRRVRGAIGALPEHERMATVLYYINGYTQGEVAGFLEVPEATIRKRLQRARQRLREGMVDMVQEDLGAQRPSRDERFAEAVQMEAALREAGLGAQLAVLELLLLDGIDVNSRGRGGQTLLHWAAAEGHIDALEMLIDHGADVGALDDAGRTALQVALQAGQREAAAYLRRRAAPASPDVGH